MKRSPFPSAAVPTPSSNIKAATDLKKPAPLRFPFLFPLLPELRSLLLMLAPRSLLGGPGICLDLRPLCSNKETMTGKKQTRTLSCPSNCLYAQLLLRFRSMPCACYQCPILCPETMPSAYLLSASSPSPLSASDQRSPPASQTNGNWMDRTVRMACTVAQNSTLRYHEVQHSRCTSFCSVPYMRRNLNKCFSWNCPVPGCSGALPSRECPHTSFAPWPPSRQPHHQQESRSWHPQSLLAHPASQRQSCWTLYLRPWRSVTTSRASAALLRYSAKPSFA